MEFSFTAEQDQFRESVARFMTDKSPSSDVRKLMETDDGFDPNVWRQLCGELGLTGIHIPETYGGAGFGPVELGIAMEEQGRALLCAPYLSSSVMAGYALLTSASEEQKRAWLPAIADGSQIATLAISEDLGLWRANDICLTAKPNKDAYTLAGRKRFVLDGCVADMLFVVARTEAGLSLFKVDTSAKGLRRTPLPAMDPTRKIAEIELAGTPAELVGQDGGFNLDATFDSVLVAFANELAGGAEAMLSSVVEYSKLRVQFGRPIGSFQAIKHRCADLMVEVELAKAAAYQAAQQLASGEEATELASLAKATASDAYLFAARECIQFHGGIGFTWENDTHLWFKRAKSSEVFLGTPQEHRERMLQAVGV